MLLHINSVVVPKDSIIIDFWEAAEEYELRPPNPSDEGILSAKPMELIIITYSVRQSYFLMVLGVKSLLLIETIVLDVTRF